MEKIFYYVYSRKLSVIIFTIIACVPIWYRASCYFGKKYHRLWTIFNMLSAGGMIFLILYITLANRMPDSRELCLIPLYSFASAQIQPEIYRSMLMNVFLFFPLGLTMPYALPAKWKHNVLIAILFGLILSIAIEFLQYYFCLGRAETDDVICNTLGCAIGTIAFRLNRTSEGNSNSN